MVNIKSRGSGMKEIAVIQMNEGGNLALPVWIRKEYGFMCGDLISICLDDENNIVLRRPVMVCALCASRENLIKFGENYICEDWIHKLSQMGQDLPREEG